MNQQCLFDLCLSGTENIFFALSKDLLIINVNEIVEDILKLKKCELINKNINSVFTEQLACDFPAILSSTKKTKIVTLSTNHISNEEVTITWEIIPLPKSIIEDDIAFWMIGKIGNYLTVKQQEELKFHNLIKYAPGLFYWKDKESVYQGCNEEFAKLAGLTSRFDVEGKTDFDLPWKDRAADYIKVDREVISTGIPHLNHEEIVGTVDKKTRNMLTSKVPLFGNDNQVIGLIGITTDITYQKKIENELKETNKKLEQESKVKTEFLENMRHDIRTPLTGIIGFSCLIRDEITDPKIKEYADNLSASSQALLDLLNEILEVIKVNSGEMPILKKKFDLRKRLMDVFYLNQAKANESKINLEFSFDERIPTYIVADAMRIHRVVLELIANALNFTKNGFVKLDVVLAEEQEHQLILKLVVEDTGIGIAPSSQDDIFKQFKRLTPSYEGVYKGSGLGLSIVKKFLDEIFGEIYVESQINVGSKFTCIIPVKKSLLNDEFGSEDVAPKAFNKINFPTNKELESTSVQLSSENISSESYVLIVEDNRMAAIAVQSILSSLGCQVDIAYLGNEAIELAKEHRYDLIFMDIGLPDMNGYEVTRRIRVHELSEGAHVPIIALTAHVDEENKQRCIEVGMNAVLAKPLAKEVAEDVLNGFIAYRKQKQVERHKELPIKDELSILEGKAIDFELAKKQLSGNVEMVTEMLMILLESLKEEVAQLTEAHQHSDWSTIKAIVHKIKGGLSYCGAVRLKNACTLLEQAMKHKSPQKLEESYRIFLSEIEMTKKAILEKNY